MKLYFHHVGSVGASDFDKTVFKDIDIGLLERELDPDLPWRSEIIDEIHHEFPEGTFNCWGVPSGADVVIQNLKPGDCVLLVESVRIDGAVPALCEVRLFWPEAHFYKLSEALWEATKYPLIFFFRTEPLSLMWINLLEHWGYNENFDPRGKFYPVADHRLSPFGGASGYVSFLRTNYGELAHASLFQQIAPDDLVLHRELPEQDFEPHELEEALETIKLASLSPTPSLTSESQRQLQPVTARDATFVAKVKQLYDARCAVCGQGAVGPNGEFEVESAHIFPKSEKGSNDLRNGICLCRRHHWAFDVGWLAIADDYTIIVRDDVPGDPEYEFISRFEGSMIRLPSLSTCRPHKMFLQAHRVLKGFE